MAKQSGVKVTIITVVYNSVNSIENCIQSALNQTYPNIEYIVIDGGSTDGTQDIIQKYTNRITHYISEPDAGISDAFNKGIKIARGDLITLLNADDFFNINSVKKVVDIYISHHCPQNTVLHGDLNVIGKSRSKIEKPRLISRFKFELPVLHPTSFLTKDIYAKYLYSTEYKIAMDYELLSKVYADKGNFVYIPYIINNMSEGGISNTSVIEAFKEVKKASKNNLKIRPIFAEIYFFYRVGLYSLMVIKRKLFN